MNNFLSVRAASFGLLSVLALIVIFYLIVLVGILPYEIVWGGRLEDSSQMIVFEILSITLNLFMLFVVGVRAGFVMQRTNPLVIKSCLWLMAILFIVNTIGNLFSINQWEKMIFTPITIMLTIFSLRLALSK